MTSHIEALVQQLDGDDDASYGARARLVAIGGDATLAIADGLPALGRFGRLTAIEAFQEVADPRCGPALIALLNDDEPTVYDQPAALGALLRLDAHLGTHHADHFTEPDGLWDQWIQALPHLTDSPHFTATEQHRLADLHCGFANGWARR